MLRTWRLRLLVAAGLLCIGNTQVIAEEEDNTPKKANAVHFCGEALPFQEERIARQFLEMIRQSKRRVARIKGRAEAYFRIIEPILRKHNIPDDFKYLTIVESALQPNATSSAGAHGYWQFMPETARAMGLKISRRVDERRSLLLSTQAACRYFNQLFEQLGSWTLVAAAYNAGPARIDQYMNRAQSMSYYDLNANRETGEYLYRVLATKELFTRPQNYEVAVSKPLKIKSIPIKKQETAEELFAPTGKINSEDSVFRSIAIPVPAGAVAARLREAGAMQKGQIWIFEVSESKVMGSTLLEIGDKLYATVEDIDTANGMIYLRASRLYSAHRHDLYTLPLGAISPEGQLGISTDLNPKSIVYWRRL